MKYLSTAVVALASLATTAAAFCPQQQAKTASTALDSLSRRESFAKAASLIGGAVATGAALPASAEEKLDFSLPSYDSSVKNTGGFGDGAEAILNMEGRRSGTLSDPGSGEAEKQREAMKKAEEARKAKLAENCLSFSSYSAY